MKGTVVILSRVSRTRVQTRQGGLKKIRMMGGLMDDGETIKQVKVEAGGASFFVLFFVCV